MLDRQSKLNLIAVCFIIFLPLSWAVFFVGSVYRALTILLVGLFFIFMNGKYTYSKSNVNLWISWTVFVVYAFLSVIWGKNYDSSIANSMGLFLVYLIVIVFMSFSSTPKTESWCDYAWIVVGVTCLVLFSFGETATVGDYGSRTTLIIIGNQTDPNEFAGMLSIPMALSIFYIVQSKKIWVQLCHFALIVLELYVVLLSGSRGALISSIVAMTVTVISHSKFSFSRIVFLCISAVILFWIVSKYAVLMIPEDVLSRFSIEALEEDGGSGRSDIWKSSFSQYISGGAFEMIFGHGYGGIIAHSDYGWTSTMHNQFLQVLFNYGIIGFLLYINLLYQSFVRIARYNRKYLGAFVGMMVMGMTITMSPSYKPLWILMLTAFFNHQDKSVIFNGMNNDKNDCV